MRLQTNAELGELLEDYGRIIVKETQMWLFIYGKKEVLDEIGVRLLNKGWEVGIK